MTGYELYLDTETFSEVPIKHGTHAYAQGCEILMFAYAKDEGPVTVVEHPTPEFMQALINGASKIIIHNSQFDRTVLRANGVYVPVEKIHDTMIQAMLHSLPGSLDTLCDILSVPTDLAKRKDGKKLIQLFTKPLAKNRQLRRATKETHPKEWQDFCGYAGGDILSMREVRKRLPVWNFQAAEISLWQLDQAINDRGVAIDLDLAHAALRAAKRETERLAEEMEKMTYGAVSSATQRNRTLAYLRDEMGVVIDDLKKGTVNEMLLDDGLPREVRELLENRNAAAATSPAKYTALLNGTSPDGRLRGTLQFCGALRTARWGGRLFQPQNLPRPTLKQSQIDMGIVAMKADVEDMVCDDVMALCTSAIRGCIVSAPGHKLAIADLSNIEGRMLAFLAGEEWKLQAFRDFDAGTGHDLYKITAGGILGKDPADVTADERQGQGKVPELACGFQGALGAFQAMAAVYGVHLPEERVLEIVKAWRRKHPKTVNLWYGSERAAISAIKEPGKTFEVGKLRFRCDTFGPLQYLRLILPSGRSLCYPRPKLTGGRHVCSTCNGDGFYLVGGFVEDHGVPARRSVCVACEGTGERDLGPLKITYEGVDQYTRQWGLLKTYGGKLVENATQAASRDVFAVGMRIAERRGYKVVLHVHDELLTEVPDNDNFTAEGLADYMAAGASWTVGLPLAAAGFETYRYRKG